MVDEDVTAQYAKLVANAEVRNRLLLQILTEYRRSRSMLVRQCGDGKQRLYRSLELLQCSMTTRLIHGSNAS